MKVEVRMSGLDGVLETLKALPGEVVSKRGGPVRAALRKGALVLQRQAVANLQAVVADVGADGTSGSTGLTEKAVVVTRGKAPSDGKGERYLVRVKRNFYIGKEAVKTARRNAKAGGKKADLRTTRKSAQLLEYGSSRQPAEPWLRPAFEAKKTQAASTVETELLASITRIVKRLSAQNKGR